MLRQVSAVSRGLPDYICRRCASSLSARIAQSKVDNPNGVEAVPLIRRPKSSQSIHAAGKHAGRVRPAAIRRRRTGDGKEAVIYPRPKQLNQDRHIDEADPDAPVAVDPPIKVPIPQLAHGLDRVLFNPGVYYLQDPRSHVYNFDPYLQEITPVKDFNFDALTDYITSSRDSTLDEIARSNDLKFVGSTSSMTGVLAQFHFFISNWRPVDVRRLSTAFSKKLKTFTPSQKAPASIYLRHNNGIYAIDADKSFDSGETVLSFLGRSMEKMLTLPPSEFSRLRKENSADAPTEKPRESYHYSKLGNLLMRSQLDCYDPRLPGNGTFDLKTRAVLPVRLDVKNAAQGAGYQILQSVGLLESFEREYYDMIRAAFLKYSLQVRIGKMDGIFVAFHNTERVFGFQYISLSEMDEAIHGIASESVAAQEFNQSLRQLDAVLTAATEKYPEQSMCLTFAAREGKTPVMDVVIEPLTEDEIIRRQQGEVLEALKAAQLNDRLTKMSSTGPSLEKMSTTLEKIIDNQPTTQAQLVQDPPKDKHMLRLTGRNQIDNETVSGPPTPSSKQQWTFDWEMTHITDQHEITKELTLLRDKQAAAFTDIYDSQDERIPFLTSLRKMSEKGRERLRIQQDSQKDKAQIIFKTMEREYHRSFSSTF